MHRRALEVGRRRTKGFDAGVYHIDLVVGRRVGSDYEVGRRTGLGERRRAAAVGMDYAKVRHREEAVVADIPDGAVEGSRAAAVEGILGAVERGVVLAADSLEEGRRSPPVVGGILEEDTSLGEVVGSPLANVGVSMHLRIFEDQSHVAVLRKAGIHLGVDRTWSGTKASAADLSRKYDDQNKKQDIVIENKE